MIALRKLTVWGSKSLFKKLGWFGLLGLTIGLLMLPNYYPKFRKSVPDFAYEAASATKGMTPAARKQATLLETQSKVLHYKQELLKLHLAETNAAHSVGSMNHIIPRVQDTPIKLPRDFADPSKIVHGTRQAFGKKTPPDEPQPFLEETKVGSNL